MEPMTGVRQPGEEPAPIQERFVAVGSTLTSWRVADGLEGGDL